MNAKTARILYQAIQDFRKEPVSEKLKWLETTQWWSREEIARYQLNKLKEILVYALEKIPYYQQSFKAHSNLIRHLKSISELSSLPFLTKEQLRHNFSSLQNPGFKGRILIDSTSGSTGDPMRFVHDRTAGAFARALLYREHRWHNLDIGEKEARFYGTPLDASIKFKEKIKDFMMNRKRFCVYDLSESSLRLYHKKINSYRPPYLYGYTSAIFELISFMRNQNLRFQGNFLKAIIVTSEVLVDEQRELMESYLKVPVINEYGCSEVGIIAAECPRHGLHISAENIIVEVIKDGLPAKSGQAGEVVITGLNNLAMPLIRYKLGDVAILTDKFCSCGRGLPLLENIEGRVNNMVVTPEGKISSGMIFYYISRSLIENNGGIKKFKIVQDKIDRITFQIVKDHNFSEENLKAIVRMTHKYLSPSLQVDFEFFSELPHKTDGKIQHFLSKVRPSF